MASIQQEGIALGPGNEVKDVPQNEPLLRLLSEKTDPLQVDQLLKLAQFYEAYPGTAPLGKHNALVGLATQAGPQVVLQAFADYGVVEEGIEWASTFDQPGDERGDRVSLAAGVPSTVDESNTPDRADATVVSFQISIRQVSVNGIGLLVETFDSIDVNKVERARHFILGVAPAL